MAILSRRFSPPSHAKPEDRITALENYIKYLEEQLEAYASNTGKKINEMTKDIENLKK